MGPAMPRFRAVIALLGINPYVSVPAPHLRALLRTAGRSTSPIPISVGINGATFRQNLVKYQGAWRLYLNTPMRKAAQKDVGDRITLLVEFDAEPRVEPMPPALSAALAEHESAKATFDTLPPSRKKEILRYLNQAKTDATLQRNVAKVIRFLLGEEPATLAALVRKPTRRE
jgi:hypothetical protein